MNPLCIYHGGCVDGFGAAWAVRKFFGDGNVDFHAATYGNPPPDVAGRDVFIVDFSYKRPVLDEMARAANSVLILDHHKTAAEDLAGYMKLPGWSVWRGAAHRGHLSVDIRIAALFDMERSGAGLAWDYFHPGEPRPTLLNHIEDRDLWRFNLPGSREIHAALVSYPYDFEVWDRLMATDIEDLRREGVAIERKHNKDVAELLATTTRWMKIGDRRVPMANLPHTMASDAGHALCEQHGTEYAGIYFDTPEGRVFSLRSLKDGADVSEVAQAYGGGGHRHAAGFRAPFNELGQFEV